MRVLYIFLFTKGVFSIAGPTEVAGGEGETLLITCHYRPFYRDKVKYWCRGYQWYFCSVVIKTDQPQNRAEAAVIISDDKNLGSFTVRMRDVRIADTGWYWCAIQTTSRGVGARVKITISRSTTRHVSHVTTVTGTVGQQRQTFTSPSPVTTAHRHTTSATTTAASTMPAMPSTDFELHLPYATVGMTRKWRYLAVMLKMWSIARYLLALLLCLILIIIQSLYVL